MGNWVAPQRPNAYAEQTLIEAILDGTFPPHSSLPGERTLAEEFGVTRPTLREAIQRLSRDGWLTVRQGKSTVVNDYWQEGGLNVLSALAKHSPNLPQNFITQILEVRLHLAPAYTRSAIEQDGSVVEALLLQAPLVQDTPQIFAAYDWRLHRQLTISSGNPIFTLILNGFGESYEHFARIYFESPDARKRSKTYYNALLIAAERQDGVMAEESSRRAMIESIHVWANAANSGE